MAAAFLETRRYAVFLGATTAFAKSVSSDLASPFNRSAAMGGLREGDRGLPGVHSPAAA